MTDEIKLHQAINRQARARALLDNELLQDAFAHLEGVYVESWKTCIDPALRDELWRSQANLANVRKHLHKAIDNGKLAQAEIDQLTDQRKRFG